MCWGKCPCVLVCFSPWQQCSMPMDPRSPIYRGSAANTPRTEHTVQSAGQWTRPHRRHSTRSLVSSRMSPGTISPCTTSPCTIPHCLGPDKRRTDTPTVFAQRGKESVPSDGSARPATAPHGSPAHTGPKRQSPCALHRNVRSHCGPQTRTTTTRPRKFFFSFRFVSFRFVASCVVRWFVCGMARSSDNTTNICTLKRQHKQERIVRGLQE